MHSETNSTLDISLVLVPCLNLTGMSSGVFCLSASKRKPSDLNVSTKVFQSTTTSSPSEENALTYCAKWILCSSTARASDSDIAETYPSFEKSQRFWMKTPGSVKTCLTKHVAGLGCATVSVADLDNPRRRTL